MRKILVIQTAFIGDAILATALLEKLHSFYPEAQIDFLVRHDAAGLFNAHPFIHQLLVWDKRANKYLGILKLIQNVRANKYDTVINCQRFAATGLITALSGAAYKAGFKKNPLSFLFTYRAEHQIGNGIHETERNQQLIAPITDAEAALPSLYPSPADFEKVKEFQSHPYICLAPGSVWFTKRMPLERWAHYINSYLNKYQVFIIGGNEDIAAAEALRSLIESPTLNLCGKLNLLQSAALMQNAVLNLTNDSSPVHLASSMRAPVITAFCSTTPMFGFGPVGTQTATIETMQELSCKPCHIHGLAKCPQQHFKCSLIEDADFTKALAKFNL